jgi:hypothetical protein
MGRPSTDTESAAWTAAQPGRGRRQEGVGVLDVRHVDPTSVLRSRSGDDLPWIEYTATSASTPIVVFDTTSPDVLSPLRTALADGERVVLGPKCLEREPLIQLVARSGREAHVFPCLASRFDALITTMSTHVAAGSIGTPLVLRVCAPLPLQRVSSGDLGVGTESCSVFDLCQRLLGNPTAILCHPAEHLHATAGGRALEVNMRHAGGALATIWLGAPGSEDVRIVEIVGTGGSVCIDAHSHQSLVELTLRRADGETVVHVSFTPDDLLAQSLDILADQMLRWIRSDHEATDSWSAVSRAHQLQGALPEPRVGWVDVATGS